ncbi:Oxysterol-binding protein 3 [Coemansia erecta]|uniref:Oxysterol-binding protein 3 n=1 Tax=Coemansia erecta TaxID=147472 RepID=A0A9W7XWB0_9FUNG|nr:Oxysterol-binding protein 3 [Coemansia erecta]
MEEVEILPRDAYLHTVNIARVPCTLQWWFTTKRKNIDFGLFQRKGTEEASSVAGSMHEDSGSSTIGRQRGLGHFKLQDRGVTELMALKHYESSKSTIKGAWHVGEAGSYVLYFDNSFSKNTSKRVSFCVAVKEEAREEPRVDFSGWLLKKKRKRMQGWARRWFAIQDAWLVYSTTEGGVPRAKIDVAGAVISASKEDRSITIDADEGFFQLRGQTQEEYEAWVRALKRAKDAAGEAHSAGATLQSDRASEQPTYRAPSNVAKAHIDFADSVDKLSQLLGGIGDPALRERALQYLQAASESENALHSLVGSSSMHSAVSEMSYPVALTSSRGSWHSESDVFYDTNDVLELVGASVQHSPKSDEVRDDDVSDDEDGFSDRGSHEGTESSGRSSRLRQDLIRDPDFVEALARNSIQIGTTPEQASEGGEAAAAGETGDSGGDPRAVVTIDSTRRLLAGYEPRTRLPAETCAANVSLISILRKNVGKDLSSIAMPLVMNEPINALQSLCEELMYQRLLEIASEQSDSMDRLMYVAAFAISALSSKKPRAERKPFNPLLGETYEMVEASAGFRFVAEKVSHHPPVMACYADAPAYRFWQDSSGKSKFWGKSMEIIQTSNVHVELLAHADHFTWAKPSALVRGLIAGPRTVDFTGEMTIVNHATGDRCAVSFKEGGLFSSSADEVECRLFRAGNSTCERVLRGCWSSHLRHERGPGHHADTLWTAAAQPADAEKYYSFNFFTMRLNDLPQQLRPLLPPTDTRLRPDQRAYEEGRVDEAEGLKTELEEAQRARKRRRDEAGVQWAAKWFELRDDTFSPDGSSWQYRGGYWAARTKHEFPPTDQLW